MPYRDVTMVETKELFRLWLSGVGKKTIATRLGFDPKTVRRYIAAGQALGLSLAQGPEGLTEELLARILTTLKEVPGRPRGQSRDLCAQHRAFIEGQLKNRVRLSKIGKLLRREGVAIPYATLYRYAAAELGFGQAAVTVPVADCGPGEEVQLDTGWMTHLEQDLFGKRRRFKAWIFTAVLSRHRFVYPVARETTESAIEACEAAWEFFGGVFKTVIPDNTKAIVQEADSLAPRLNPAFLEYAQARGFTIDTARVRHPKDKARVERTVPTVRDDCFAGERLQTIEQARERGRTWCMTDYGVRRHSRTQRCPLEHFEAVEKPALIPAPVAAYDIPLWVDAKVARDHLAQVARALYSLPTLLIGKKLRVRADKSLVRFYDNGQLVKTHARQPPGGKAIDPTDFPAEKAAYAMRDLDFLKRQAKSHGDAVGRFAEGLLDVQLPWTRMRRVYALLGLTRRYGAARVEDACKDAVAQEMFDVHRLERMIRLNLKPELPTTTSRVIPIARYLRPSTQFALTLKTEGEPS